MSLICAANIVGDKTTVILEMCENAKVGWESPNRRQKVKTQSRVSVAFEKTKIEQPQVFQCLLNNGVILMIKLYITDGYVYDSL